MKQPTRVLSRLDLQLFPRLPVLDGDSHTGLADPVAKLRGQVALDPLAFQFSEPGKQRTDDELGSGVRKQHPAMHDTVARFVPVHHHLVHSPIISGRGEDQLLAYGPEAQKADPVFSLNSFDALLLEALLEGIADVGGDVFEIGNAFFVQGNAGSVVDDFQVGLAFFPAPDNGDVLGPGVNAVLYELGDGFQGIVL